MTNTKTKKVSPVKTAARGGGTKKTPAKKGAATPKTAAGVTRTRAASGNSRLGALARELSLLIPRLDEEGLLFLIEQAQVHLYNMQVDELNQTMMRNAGHARSGKSGKSEKAKKPGTAGLEIQISADKHSYYIVYQGKWVMFTGGEILQLAKIASAQVDDYEKTSALYRWFERERRDVFGTIPIEGKTDPILIKMAAVIRKNCKVAYK
jgi:hypothetical protein